MSQDVHKTDVLTPSVASVAFCIVGLLAALFFIVLPRLSSDTLLTLVFGQDASLTLINSSKESYGPLLEELLRNDLLGRAVVFGVWAFVGLCAFVIVTSVSSAITTIGEQKREMDYVHQNKDALIHNDLVNVAYRLGIAAAWSIFVVLCIRYVLTYFAVTGFVALSSGDAADWLAFTVASIVLLLALHVQVVFARLLVGRTRVWQD